jgi:hypothetical protein
MPNLYLLAFTAIVFVASRLTVTQVENIIEFGRLHYDFCDLDWYVFNSAFFDSVPKSSDESKCGTIT